MNLVILIRLIGALVIISIAILISGDFGTFINVPSLVVVISGTSATTPARVSLEKFFGSFKVGLKSVLHKREYLH